MRSRVESRRGIGVLAGLALASVVFGFGPALAQAEGKSCSHEGKMYKGGEQVTIAGKPMVCDGVTGSWVPAK